MNGRAPNSNPDFWRYPPASTVSTKASIPDHSTEGTLLDTLEVELVMEFTFPGMPLDN